jgi:hypothetical protein
LKRLKFKIEFALRSSGVWIVLLGAIALSLLSFAYFFHQGLTNIYGDGLYHLNTARKVIDMPEGATLWQRYVQLGTPWLPLPHVLMLPFVWNDTLWRTGLAGSLISMLSFVVVVITVFKLSRLFYTPETDDAPWLALLSTGIFALNPNALYMQTTPMTELPFMALLILSVYYFQTWVFHQTPGELALTGLLMTLTALTRYEGWTVLPVAGVLVFLLSKKSGWQKVKDGLLWGAIAVSGPLYWLWHNWAIYGNPWEFYLGPYSAKAYLIKAWAKWLDLLSPFPGVAPAWAALAVIACLTPVVFCLAFVGVWTEVLKRREKLLTYAPTFLLLVPFAFFAYSLGRGEIQVSVFPPWLYNVRYGLPHLLPAAIFAPAVVTLIQPVRQRIGLILVAFLVVLQYGLIAQAGTRWIVTFQEPWHNNVLSQRWRERAELEAYLRAHPPRGTVLMYTGDLGSIVSRANLRFSQIIHEGTSRWYAINGEIPDDVSTVIMQEGDLLWQRLQANPAFQREFVMVFSVGNGPRMSVWQRRMIQTSDFRPQTSD